MALSLKTWKEIRGKDVKDKGYRWGEKGWSSFEKRTVSVVRVACMVKSRCHTTTAMEGPNADHNRGPGGQNVADWRLLRVTDVATGPHRGWFNSGI